MSRAYQYIKEILDKTEKHEQGLVVARRACQFIVYNNLDREPKKWDTIDQLREMYDSKYPDLMSDTKELIEEECLTKYPAQYKAANRWLTDPLIAAWKEEVIEDYFNKTE